MSIASGTAFAMKLKKQNNISALFIRDGTFGEGIVYETLNIASKWNLPLLILMENNHYAQSTHSSQTFAGTVSGRAQAFQISHKLANTWDWKDLIKKVDGAVSYVRNQCRPFLLEIETYRLKAHSKGDDLRDTEEIKKFSELDPINIFLKSPAHTNTLAEIDKVIADSVCFAEQSPSCKFISESSSEKPSLQWSSLYFEKSRMSDILYSTFKELLAQDNRVLLLGEDIEAPYGGAFKVTKDLSDLFPGRVCNTPISEAAITGIGSGLALNGYIPIIEIMFGDFLTLAFDQLSQHAAKFPLMYNGQVSVPLIVRTPMGGRRGYGPTHSSSIEKHFLGIPGLNVIAINQRLSPNFVYKEILKSSNNPTLVIENKVLYTRFLATTNPRGFEVIFSNEDFPTIKITPINLEPKVTLFCYGGILEETESALIKSFEENEITCEIICPTSLYPLNIEPVLESVKKTSKILIIEEGNKVASLGSEVLAQLSENRLSFKASRLSYDSIVPADGMREAALLPNSVNITQMIKGMVA